MTENENEDTFDNKNEEQDESNKGFETDVITQTLEDTYAEIKERNRKEHEDSEDLDKKDSKEDDSDVNVLNTDEEQDEKVADTKTPVETTESERSTDDYPSTWKGALKDKWETIDPDVKAEIHRREGDMLKGLEQYRGHYNYAQEVIDVFKPYDAEITASGSNQKQVLASALNTMYILKSGTPDEKANELLNLATAYGVEINNLNSVNDRIEANMPLIDPAVEELKRENAQILTFLHQSNLEKQQAEMGLLETELDKFEADPKNKYYDEVRGEMSSIFGSSQEEISLQDVYDKAVWANPVTREKLIVERQDADRRDKAENAAGAKRTAKSNVTSKGQPLVNVNANGTLDSTIEDVWADIKSRR